METKGNVAVKLTKKNCKKVLGVLEMFGEPIYHGDKDRWGNGIVFHEDTHAIYTENEGWKGFNNYQISSSYPDRKEAKPRELRNILAREHLKVGDVCVFDTGDEEEVRVLSKVDDSVYPFESKDKGYTESYSEFLRYATDEEKALLDPANSLTPREIPKRTIRKIEIAEFIGIPVEQLEIID